MPNKIFLPAQKIQLSDLAASIPGGKIKKVFFQCELRSIANNDATFGVIAYAARKNFWGTWIIGNKVNCQDDPGKPVQQFDVVPNIAFGNNELVDHRLKKMLKNKNKIMSSSLAFQAKVSQNPHITYDITLDDGTSTSVVSTNPSPPAAPEA